MKEGKVVGNTISFVEMLNFQDNEIRISYTGKLTTNANEIKFTREVGEFRQRGNRGQTRGGGPGAGGCGQS